MQFSVALVGEETLLGKELSEALASRVPDATVAGYAASGEGNFGETEGEAVYVEPFNESSLKKTAAVLVAGSAAGAQKVYELAKAATPKPAVIDCSGFLEHLPEAQISAPLLGGSIARKGWLYAVAHPAASALVLILSRLAKYRGIRQSVINILEPASEYGRKGIAELHQQTTSLLAFKPLDKEVFDTQLSFNLLAQLGEESPTKLISTEHRIERHIATLLGNGGVTAPLPSIRLITAPVFHGFSFSMWIEFEAAIERDEVGEALASAQIEVRSKNEEAPHNVGVAGQSGLAAGDIRLDPNNPRAAWIWVAGDNLRLVADEAIEVVNALHEDRR